MFTNVFNQTVKADYAVVQLYRSELADLATKSIRAMTGVDEPIIDFSIHGTEDIYFEVAGAVESEEETRKKFEEIGVTGMDEKKDTKVIMAYLFGRESYAKVKDYADEDFDDVIFVYIPHDEYIRRTFGL